MIAAASSDGCHPTTAAELSQIQGIPLSFLQGVLLDLRRAGLLVSQRGPHGGYRLTRSPDDISVGDICARSMVR